MTNVSAAGPPEEVTTPSPTVGRLSLWNDLAVLAKPRLTSLVVVTTGVGYLLGQSSVLYIDRFISTIIGTALVAVSASALNQVWEAALAETVGCGSLLSLASSRAQK